VVCGFLVAQEAATRKQLQESGIAHSLSTWCSRERARLARREFDRRIRGPRWQATPRQTGFDDVHYHVLIPPEKRPTSPRPAAGFLVLIPRLHADELRDEKQVCWRNWPRAKTSLKRWRFSGCWRLPGPGHPLWPSDPRRTARPARPMDPEGWPSFHRRRYRARTAAGDAGAVGGAGS